MPHQGELIIGWNTTNMGTYLVSDVPKMERHKSQTYRVQHWRDKDVREKLILALDLPRFDRLYDACPLVWAGVDVIGEISVLKAQGISAKGLIHMALDEINRPQMNGGVQHTTERGVTAVNRVH